MERAAWVAISGVSGFGPARFRALLEAFDSPRAALEAGAEEICARLDLGETLAEGLAEAALRLEQAEHDLLSLEEAGIHALIWPDPEYPARLLAASSPPPVLWRTGAADLQFPGGAVAVIGSREAPEEALALTRRWSAQLAEVGVTVISGLAAGVDAAAHEGALDVGGPTLGVCGAGILTALASGDLPGRVSEAGGLCSELSPQAPRLPQSLFARNRIIAGLSEAVIVIASRADGGAVHTARTALREGRAVFAVKWEEGELGGNGQLLGEGAGALRPEDDVCAASRRGDPAGRPGPFETG